MLNPFFIFLNFKTFLRLNFLLTIHWPHFRDFDYDTFLTLVSKKINHSNFEFLKCFLISVDLESQESSMPILQVYCSFVTQYDLHSHYLEIFFSCCLVHDSLLESPCGHSIKVNCYMQNHSSIKYYSLFI